MQLTPSTKEDRIYYSTASCCAHNIIRNKAMISENMPVQCIGDICTLKSPLFTDIDISLPQIIFYMNLMEVEAAAVVDEDNHCIGFVTGDDVIDHVCDENKGGKEPCVADIMRPPNMSVYLDDPVEQALIMMRLHKIDWLPVIDFDTQKFSGLVCREDIENMPTNIVPFPKGKLPYDEAA
jgi:CBS domain-containing protein